MGAPDASTSGDLGLELALQRFEEETRRSEAIDTKATLVLGFAGVVAGLLYDGLSGMVTGSAFEPLKPEISILLAAGFLAVLCAALLALAALWTREFQGGPGSSILMLAVRSNPVETLKLDLADQYASAADHNWTLNQRKVRLLQWSFVAIALGTLIIFASLFFILLEQGVFHEPL